MAKFGEKYRASLPIIGLLLIPQLTFAQTLPPAQVTVTGEAIAKLKPDQVTLPVTVYTEDKNLNAAKAANDKKLKSVLEIAKKLKVDDRKLATTNTQIAPQYDWNQQTNKQVFRSYMVSNSINITLSDISKLAELFSALADAGIDRIGSVQFGLQDEKKARDELLAQAALDAKTKAEKLAASLNVKIGKPLMINENSSGTIPPAPPMPMARLAMAAKAESTPDLPSGELEIRQNVTVSFALE